MDPSPRFRPDAAGALQPLKGRRRGRSTSDDAELVERFRAGDPEALAMVYRQYGGSTWSVAFAVLGDRSLADDTVQETFVRAWRAASRFDPARPLGPWLFSIARRAAVDVYRREMRPTRGDHAPESDVVVGDPGVDAAWQRWEIQRALARLSEGDRELVCLTTLYGYTQREVSERLGVPLGTVKSRTHRAQRRLAALLSHLREPESASDADPARATRLARPRTGRVRMVARESVAA